MKSIEKRIEEVLIIGKKDPFSKYQMATKTMEELGEFSEALLFEDGALPHKKIKETTFEEGADVIQCVLATLSKHHEDMTPKQILERLNEAFKKKNKKYEESLSKKIGK